MRFPLALPAAAIVVAALAAPASAQGVLDFEINPNMQFQIIQPNAPANEVFAQNRIYLSCEIRDEKRAIIRNTTGAPTPEGETIYLEVITMPDGQHIVEGITNHSIPAGDFIAPGVPSSSACYAWYEQEPMLLME